MGESLPTTDLEIFGNFHKVQKVITLEDPPSASRSRPAGRQTETPIGGCLFPLGTLKNFQSPTSDRGGKSLVRGCFSTERGQRDPRPAFSSTVTSLPPEKGDSSRESAIGESFSTGRSTNTAIGGSFGPTLFSKNFQSPKGDYTGKSAIGESFSTGRSRNTAIGASFGPTLFSKNVQSPKGDYTGKSAIGESFSTGRSRNTAIGGSFGRRTLFPKNFQSPKKKKKKVTYTLPPFESSRRDRHFYRIARTRSE